MENLIWSIFGLSPIEFLITAYPFYVLGVFFSGTYHSINRCLFYIYNKYGVVQLNIIVGFIALYTNSILHIYDKTMPFVNIAMLMTIMPFGGIINSISDSLIINSLKVILPNAFVLTLFFSIPELRNNPIPTISIIALIMIYSMLKLRRVFINYKNHAFLKVWDYPHEAIDYNEKEDNKKKEV